MAQKVRKWWQCVRLRTGGEARFPGATLPTRPRNTANKYEHQTQRKFMLKDTVQKEPHFLLPFHTEIF